MIMWADDELSIGHVECEMEMSSIQAEMWIWNLRGRCELQM